MVNDNEIEEFKARVNLFMEYINQHEIPNYQSQIKFSDIDKNYLNNYKDAKIYLWLVRELNRNFNNFYKEIKKYQNDFDNGYYKIMSKIEKKLGRISNEKKMAIVMKYLNQINIDIPTGRDRIRFCDIDKTVYDESYVGVWIQTSLEYKEEEFIENYTQYQKLYPIAYHKLEHKINKRDSLFITEQRIRSIILYSSKNFIKKEDRFCDISDNTNDKIEVWSWIRTKIYQDKKKFLELMEKYCNEYQININDLFHKMDYDKMINSKFFLNDKRRLQTLITYLEQGDLSPLHNKKLSFSDLDETFEDKTKVVSWLVRNIEKGQDEFLKELANFKNIYPNGYQKIFDRVKQYNKKSNDFATPYPTKVSVFMKYIQENNIPKGKDVITFHDLDETIESRALITTWLVNEMCYHLSEFIDEIEKYKTKYPKSYQKISLKINSSKERIKKERLLLLNELKKIRKYLVQENVQSFSKKKVK